MAKKIKLENVLVENYSFKEQVIGIWENEDGTQQPLYGKTFNFGVLPNTSSKTVNHNINNIKMLLPPTGVVFGTEYKSVFMSIPNADPDGLKYSIYLIATKTFVKITTGSDRSSLSGYVFLKYTKTTD